jgi:hypothetical protein
MAKDDIGRQEGFLPHRTMGKQPTTGEWRIKAMNVLDRVGSAETRLSASLSLNQIAMLAAADELEAATRDATIWVQANPCPDVKLGTHVTWMLTTCADVALTAERAVTDPDVETEEAMGRLGNLLAVIDCHSQTRDAW